MRKILIAALLLCSAQIASAEAYAFRTADQVYTACKSSKADDAAFCKGYIMGVVDAYGTFNDPTPSNLICLPPKTKYETLRTVLIDFLDAHPEKRQYTGSSEVLLALMRAFPCETGD